MKALFDERHSVVADDHPEPVTDRDENLEFLSRHVARKATCAGQTVTLPPTSIQRDVDSGGWFGRFGRGERRGLVRSLASSAAPDPVAG